MQHSPSSETGNCTPTKAILRIYQTRTFMAVFTKARQWTMSLARYIQPHPHTKFPERFNIVPSTSGSIKRALPCRSFSQCLIRIYDHSHAFHMSYPSHPSSFQYPNTLTSYKLCIFLYSSVTSPVTCVNQTSAQLGVAWLTVRPPHLSFQSYCTMLPGG